MNAAARLVHRGLLSRHLVLTHLLSRKQFIVFLLLFAAMLSALSTVYVTEATRILHATFERNVVEQDHLHVERGQLLLERSTWMVSARIQQIAESKLGMIIPNHKSVVIIHE